MSINNSSNIQAHPLFTEPNKNLDSTLTSEYQKEVIRIILYVIGGNLLESTLHGSAEFKENLSPNTLRESLLAAIDSSESWNIILQKMAWLLLTRELKAEKDNNFFDTTGFTLPSRMFEIYTQLLLLKTRVPFSPKIKNYIEKNFTRENCTEKNSTSHTLISTCQLNINHSLYAIAAWLKSVIQFHTEVYGINLSPELQRCINMPTYPIDTPSKTLDYKKYPDALTLFQALSALFVDTERSPYIQNLLRYLGTISIWNWCFKSSTNINTHNVEIEVFPLLHLGALAFEGLSHDQKLMQKSANRHQYELLTSLGYPKDIKFLELAPLREPPIPVMTEGFNFEDRRMILELIARAKIRFYDTGNVKNSLLWYLQSSPEKLIPALDIIKSGKVGTTLTNAQLIHLLENNIPLSRIRSLTIREGVVDNIKSVLGPQPQVIPLKLVISTPAPKINSIPVSSEAVPTKLSISPEENQLIRIHDLAGKLGIAIPLFPVPTAMLSKELLDSCFKLSKRGDLWGSHNLNLVPIFRDIWSSKSTLALTTFIAKSQTLKILSAEVYKHPRDQRILNALRSKNSTEIQHLTTQFTQDYQALILGIDPALFSSTVNWTADIGSGGFATILTRILEYLAPQVNQSNEQILLGALSFSWKDKRLSKDTLGVGFNSMNLPTIGHLPEIGGFYSAVEALSKKAKNINIGGKWKGGTIGTAIHKVVRNWSKAHQ